MKLTAKLERWTQTASPLPVPYHTYLIKIMRGYPLEGTDSTRKIGVELYKLNMFRSLSVPNRGYVAAQETNLF